MSRLGLAPRPWLGGPVSAISVWAPGAARVRIVVDGDAPTDLTRLPDGRWSGPTLPPGARYAFLLDDSPEPAPDPASRRQPDGVHAASEVYDPDAYAWRDDSWRGRDLTASDAPIEFGVLRIDRAACDAAISVAARKNRDAPFAVG